MAEIIWIGTPFFAPWLSEAGHKVALLDFPEPGRCYVWADLLRLSGVEKPDLVVVTDRSPPPLRAWPGIIPLPDRFLCHRFAYP